MGNLFSDKYDDHFYSSKKDEEEQKKKEQQPVEETPEEREERELRELTYDRSSKRKRILIIGGVVLLVLGVGIALWLRYFRPYIVSEERGVILKVQSEGTILKTYEVQMISEKYIADTVRAYKSGFEFTIKGFAPAIHRPPCDGEIRRI